MSSFRFSVDEIATICKAELLQISSEHQVVTDVVIDSRHIDGNLSSLFVALKGERHNGHHFLNESFDKGIRIFLVSEYADNALPVGEVTILKVSNTLAALQLLAAAHRNKFHIPVVAITGSNGKTMVKEWLFQLLSPDKNVIRSPKSYNSQVGVPLSVCKLSAENELAIFEAGISQTGEMSNLEKVIQPTAGIFTNVGSAHDENFIDHRQKAAEKLQLFVHCKKLIYCSDHYEIDQKLISSGLNKKIDLFSWGSKDDAQLHIVSTTQELQGSTVTGRFEGKEVSVTMPFTDKASVENLIHCWAFMLSEGYAHADIAGRLRRLTPIEMRLELKEGINRCTIINDSYNSDINSLSIAIDFLEKNKEYKRKTIILSDILQSGKQSEILAGEIARMISRRGIDRFVGIGPSLYASRNKFSGEALFFKSTEDFLKEFDLTSFHEEMILLKGARPFGFERISSLIEEKAHETILETDLNALTHNINFFRNKLSPGTRIMAMVKAFAYGSGAIEIARHLEYHRIDYLAVAYADEGVALRKAGITLPVMVMSPEENNFYFLFKYQLEPEIYSFATLTKLLDSIRQFSGFINLPVKIHLKMDSGMHRLGFSAGDTDQLFSLLSDNKHLVQVQSIFSHFVASDEPQYNDFSKQQLKSFADFAGPLEEKLEYTVIKHIANSAGALVFPEAQLDMVRIGIGLYGIDPSGTFASDLQPVVSLKTRILQIKEVEGGESVGYSRKAISNSPRRTATLAAGYADGLHRVMGNGHWNVCINGHFVPLIGNICMDMCMADITGFDDIREGDEAEIFGVNCLLTDYSKAMGTIPYEALTSVSSRVKRVYIQQD